MLLSIYYHHGQGKQGHPGCTHTKRVSAGSDGSARGQENYRTGHPDSRISRIMPGDMPSPTPAQFTRRYNLPRDGSNPALIAPWPEAHHAVSNILQEDTMRRLLVAAALGLGLLAAGATGAAAVSPYRGTAPAMSQPLMPVHYEHRGYHRPHYVPPPRHHWRRHAPPPPPRHGWRHQHPYQYGAR